mmetsp:Transcript_16832/g.40356  ORF Transcript_16832/g.40356 Transcript_16832/m.40356 type:complete len:325 (-) Transcript_16832:49-1023(-)
MRTYTMAGLFALLFLASCSLSLAFSPAVPLQLRVKSHAVSAIPSLRVSQSNILPAYSLGHRFRTGLKMAEKDEAKEGEAAGTPEGGDAAPAGGEDEGEEGDGMAAEFEQRKVEILEKELAEATAKVAALEAELSPLEELKAKGVLTEASAVELKDTYLRLAADFDNFRKRSAGDLGRATETATASVVKELLVVLDNFERAGQAIKTETEREASINNSYQAVNKELLKVLAKLRVEPIEPLGMDFDPTFHNAIQQVESTEYKEGVVCNAMQRGYKIGDKVVREALVVVSSGPGPEGGPEGDAAEAEAEAAEAAEAEEEPKDAKKE